MAGGMTGGRGAVAGAMTGAMTGGMACICSSIGRAGTAGGASGCCSTAFGICACTSCAILRCCASITLCRCWYCPAPCPAPSSPELSVLSLGGDLLRSLGGCTTLPTALPLTPRPLRARCPLGICNRNKSSKCA